MMSLELPHVACKHRGDPLERCCKIGSDCLGLLDQRVSVSQDEMLPSSQMRELYSIVQEAGAKNATWVEFQRAGHMGQSSLTSFPPQSIFGMSVRLVCLKPGNLQMSVELLDFQI